MAKELVMIVDDDPVFRRLLGKWLEEDDYSVLSLGSGEDCLAQLHKNPKAICLDVVMETMNGIDVLKELRRRNSDLPVIMITAKDTAKTAVEAMKAGAYDYLVKPINKLRFKTAVQKSVEKSNLTEQLHRLRTELAEQQGFGNIIGKSESIKAVFRQINRVADTNINVLIQGESGTGKELVARAIHANSPYRQGAFVAINCGAVPENLQESEFLGHEKGAYTGAVQTQVGKLEMADGGTVFLDEVAEMSLSMQVKLLRFLQERNFERVGGRKKISVHLRIISATNKILEELLESGAFREDLYYRLMVYPITIPPLRERKEDIPLLAAHFLSKYEKDTRKRVHRISPEAMEMILTYPWPGNVRELENVILRAMLSTETDVIIPKDLPTVILEGSQALPEDEASRVAPAGGSERVSGIASLEEMEKRSLAKALRITGGNITQAAKQLGIGRATCYRKVKAYNLESLLGKD